jgi:hypothetical protein
VSDQHETDFDAVLDESTEDDKGLYEVDEAALSYFGADFDVRGLVQRLNEGDIFIPRFDPDGSSGSSLAGFQRKEVWSRARMESFIESLLLGWPVPGIFLVVDTDQRYLVLDGQQRLTALQCFFSGEFRDGSPFILRNVAAHLQDVTYATLEADSRRRLNNTFIQATIIEPRGNGGRDAVYRLFGRLNSGGVSLTPQEIRVALFLGPAVDWIRKLNSNEDWRTLYGPLNQRLKDHELILRSLAMEEVLTRIGQDWDDPELEKAAYSPPMSSSLNEYLSRHRDLSDGEDGILTEAFKLACRLLVGSDGRNALRLSGRINAAHADAVLAALMNRARKGGSMPTLDEVTAALERLRGNDEYLEFVTRSTSHRENVFGRLRLAEEAFG